MELSQRTFSQKRASLSEQLLTNEFMKHLSQFQTNRLRSNLKISEKNVKKNISTINLIIHCSFLLRTIHHLFCCFIPIFCLIQTYYSLLQQERRNIKQNIFEPKTTYSKLFELLCILNQEPNQLIQIVEYINLGIPYGESFAQMADKYLLVTNQNITQTFLFTIQNFIELEVNLTNAPSTELMLTAYNNISSAQQYIFFLNGQYQPQQEEVTNKKKTILIVSLSVFFVIMVGIIFCMAYYKSKSLSNSQYFEMIPSNNLE